MKVLKCIQIPTPNASYRFMSSCHVDLWFFRPQGLVLGITTTPPAALARAAPEGFEAADDVPNSWSFGAATALRTGDVWDNVWGVVLLSFCWLMILI